MSHGDNFADADAWCRSLDILALAGDGNGDNDCPFPKVCHHIRTDGPLGYEIEACFCQDSLCNSAHQMSSVPILLSFLFSVLIKVLS